MIGEFHDGVGQFYGQDSFNGRSILVRFTISDITADSCRFEQAFSSDGGQTGNPIGLQLILGVGGE